MLFELPKTSCSGEECDQLHFRITGAKGFSLQKRQNSIHTAQDRRTVLIFLMKERVDSLLQELFQRDTARDQARQVSEATLGESIEHVGMVVRVTHAVCEKT